MSRAVEQAMAAKCGVLSDIFEAIDGEREFFEVVLDASNLLQREMVDTVETAIRSISESDLISLWAALP
ncbi:MAG: hypothetical protein ACR5LD_09390 [Symbiopectobacterium sp.]